MLEAEFQPTQFPIYIKTDPERLPRMCTGYKVSKDYISYELTCGTCVTWHYGYELSTSLDNIDSKKPGFIKQ